MAPKREAEGFIKADPDAKRVKREGFGAATNLNSIPWAPGGSATSSAAVPKSDAEDRKFKEVPASSGRSGNNPGKKRFFGNAITARRGNDWVKAHFDKASMIVSLTVCRQWRSTWQSKDVEKEIFQRLNKAKFNVTPTEDWGFVDRHISHLSSNGFKSTSSAVSWTVTSFKNLEFQCRVKVQERVQEQPGANMDSKENVRSGPHTSNSVESRAGLMAIKDEEKKAFVRRD